MTTPTSLPCLKRILAAAAAALLAGPALAQQSAITNEPYLVPENTVEIGVEHGSGDQKDRARSGMFDGLRKHDTNGLLNFNLTDRNAESGRWLILEGRNLDLDNRELSGTWRGLGDFKLKAEYGEITRHDPRTINTGVSGIGTTNLTVSLLPAPGAGSDQNFELKRKAFNFEGMKQLGNFQVELAFKQENKDGERFWGRGFACSANYVAAGVCSAATSTVLLMLPEPVDSTIRQLEGKLNYSDGRLNLSGGYYGNFYTNNNGSLNTTVQGANIGNLNGGVLPWDANLKNYFQTPMALWPDSQAQQAYLSGNYKLTSSSRVNFKLSYTHATQNESFSGMGLSVVGPPVNPGLPAIGNTRDNLGGVLNNTKVQIGFSSQPFSDLHVHGDVNYSSTENKTPISRYNAQVLSAVPTYATWTNGPMSPKKYDAKLEGNYRLPDNYLLSASMKWQRDDAGVWVPTDLVGGISTLRQKMDTNTYRVELRKVMSDTFTGAVSLQDARTSGASSWLKGFATPLAGVFNASQDCTSVGANACVFGATAQVPFTQKDREEQKIRWNANWEPVDRLSLQGYLDMIHTQYHGPTTTSGLLWSTGNNLTLDATYAISDTWKASAYYTNSGQKLFMGHAADYDGRIRDTSQALGAGIQGAVARFRFGGDLIYLHDILAYKISPDVAASAANIALLNSTGGLPDVKYELLRLKLYGEYAIDKAQAVRLDYVYNHSFFNEWTYSNAGVPFLYSDNTTLSAKQLQSVNFFAAKYIYKFQ